MGTLCSLVDVRFTSCAVLALSIATLSGAGCCRVRCAAAPSAAVAAPTAPPAAVPAETPVKQPLAPLSSPAPSPEASPSRPLDPRVVATFQMKGIASAIDMYRVMYRTLPKALAELTQPGEQTEEPLMEAIPNDPWGHPFKYRILDEPRGKYELSSAGEDEVFGSADDLVVPGR